jgi:DNA modification methylase
MYVYRLQNGKIYHGDALEVLKKLPERSVQCCVTSPPYWGLRDYGIKGQLGQEATPQAYVENLVAVFREVRRILKDDGVLWLNLGDSYARGTRSNAVKPKELVGIPWRVAFALQADGWHLRSDIIWYKSNATPESVTDRPTKAHEYIFLLTKNIHYFYDADSIREPHKEVSLKRMGYGWKDTRTKSGKKLRSETQGTRMCHPRGKNKRTVWITAKGAYRGGHFATFPREIPETCIKAGSRIRDTILDPFAGAGTTLKAATKLGRIPIGIELNYWYIINLIFPSLKED